MRELNTSPKNISKTCFFLYKGETTTQPMETDHTNNKHHHQQQQHMQQQQQQVPSSTPSINNIPNNTTASHNHNPPVHHPAGIPREREAPNHIQQHQQHQQQQATETNNAGGPAFVPFGKRPLEFVTCYKVRVCYSSKHYKYLNLFKSQFIISNDIFFST